MKTAADATTGNTLIEDATIEGPATGKATTADGAIRNGHSPEESATSLLQISATLRCALVASVVVVLWLVVGWAMQW